MTPGIRDWCSRQFFTQVHTRNLVYNTCWEDPRCDRVALRIEPHHELLMLTSAGCNALDYVLDAPGHIYCVDMNPRQNALLELEISAIKNLPYEPLLSHSLPTKIFDQLKCWCLESILMILDMKSRCVLTGRNLKASER